MPDANLQLIYAQVEAYLTVYAEDRSHELVETRKKSERALDLALDLREDNKKLEESIGSMAFRMGELEAEIAELKRELAFEISEMGKRIIAAQPKLREVEALDGEPEEPEEDSAARSR